MSKIGGQPGRISNILLNVSHSNIIHWCKEYYSTVYWDTHFTLMS